MDALLTVTVLGRPHPLQRARSGANGHHYDTDENVAAKERIQLAVNLAGWRGPLLEGPLAVRVEFYFVQPNPTADIDNLVKTTFDGFNKFVWKDDRQVAALIARKYGGRVEDYTRIEVWRTDAADA